MVAGILEKSKRLRKAFVFIVEKLPILGAAESGAKPRNVGRVISYRKPSRGTNLVDRLSGRSLHRRSLKHGSLKHLPLHRRSLKQGLAKARKREWASAGTVVPADANRGVSPFLI